MDYLCSSEGQLAVTAVTTEGVRDERGPSELRPQAFDRIQQGRAGGGYRPKTDTDRRRNSEGDGSRYPGELQVDAAEQVNCKWHCESQEGAQNASG